MIRIQHTSANIEVIQITKERKTGMAFDSGQQLRPEREFLINNLRCDLSNSACLPVRPAQSK